MIKCGTIQSIEYAEFKDIWRNFMLNEEKVKCMTKAAAYENGPEKKNIKIESYYRGDYLGLQLIKSAIAYTAAFCILIALFMMRQSENIFLKLTKGSYLEETLKILIAVFFLGLILYECAVYGYYSVKYKRAKQSVKGFHGCLKNIHKFYEAEEAAEDITTDEEKTL